MKVFCKDCKHYKWFGNERSSLGPEYSFLKLCKHPSNRYENVWPNKIKIEYKSIYNKNSCADCKDLEKKENKCISINKKLIMFILLNIILFSVAIKFIIGVTK